MALEAGTKLGPYEIPLAGIFHNAIPLADALAGAHDKGIVHRISRSRQPRRDTTLDTWTGSFTL